MSNREDSENKILNVAPASQEQVRTFNKSHPIELGNIRLDEFNENENDNDNDNDDNHQKRIRQMSTFSSKNPMNYNMNLDTENHIKGTKSLRNPINLNNQLQQEEDHPSTHTSFTLDIDKGYKITEDKFTGLDNENLDSDENLLEVQNLITTMHPMQKLDNGDLVHFPVCKTNTSNIQCCYSQKNMSDLSSLGMGIVAYFQSLKAMAIVFFLITLINIPLIIIYLSNHTEQKIVTYQDALFKTSIGNIGAFLYNCLSIDLSIDKNTDIPKLIEMNCGSYNISNIITFAPFASSSNKIGNNENCQNFTSMVKLQTSTKCDLFNSTKLASYTDRCLGQSKCDFYMDLKEFIEPSDCFKNDDVIYFAYTCSDEYVKLIDIKMSRRLFPFIAVGIDLLGMLFLLIVLITTPCSHRILKKFFRENLIQISDYTMHIEDLNLHTANLNQEIAELLQFIQKTLLYESKIKKKPLVIDDADNNHLIYDTAYPLVTDYKLDLVAQANKLHKGKNPSEEKLNEISERIRDSLTEQPIISEMFITFTNQKYRNHLKHLYSRNKCKRCCMIMCCKKNELKHLYYKGKWINVNDNTEQPSNIVWENKSFSPCKRCCRKFFSIIIAIIILCLPFGLAIGSNYLESELNKEFNSNLDCTKLPVPSPSEVLVEYHNQTITTRNKVLTYCFCYHKSLDSFFKVGDIELDGGVQPCKTWQQMYTSSLAASIGIICVVPLFNVIFSILLELITQCERNKTLSKYYQILMVRTFVLQLLNTAIILIIVNMLITPVKTWVEYFPFFTGKYQDMDPDWYSTVGTSILFCMILNIVTPHCAPIIFCILNKCRVCCDTCCTKKITKCKTRKDYLAIYLGPEFNISARYASILTTITVILLFSSGMPILYFCCFIFMLLTYWIDKFLLLKYYQLPPKTSLYLDQLMNVILYFVMFFHLAFGIWTYGNQKILSDTQLSFFDVIQDKLQELLQTNGGITDAYYAQAFNRILFSHNIIVLIFMVILIGIMIWRFFLWKVCSCKCNKTGKTKTVNIYEAMKLECIYSNYNTRRALYKKALNSSSQSPYLNEQFFKWRIDEEKGVMIRKVGDLFNERKDLNAVMDVDETIEKLTMNFNKEMPKLMTAIKETSIKRKPTNQGDAIQQKKTLKEMRNDAVKKIGRDYTYHVVENPKYHDFAYYYIYLKNKYRRQINVEVVDK